MGYADRVPNRAVMSEHQPVPRVVPILGSTDYHLAVAVIARSSGVRCRWRAGSSLLWTPVYLAAHHHGPDDTGHFVGQRDRCELFWLARQQSQEPRRDATLFGPLDDRVAPSTSSRRRLSSPSWLILPGRCLPAVEFSRGVIPIHAAKCRAERKALASGILSAKLTPA